jgi:hypothetical protein
MVIDKREARSGAAGRCRFPSLCLREVRPPLAKRRPMAQAAIDYSPETPYKPGHR